MTLRIALSAALIAISVQAFAIADEPATRPAVPSAAALRKSTAAVDQTFRAQLAKARDAESKSTLAKSILHTSEDENDSARRFALLNKAMDVAIQAGDIDTATTAADQLDGGWAVDGLKIHAETLRKLLRNLRTPQDRTTVATQMRDVAEQAVTQRKYALAAELMDLAANAAHRGTDPALARKLSARSVEIAELKNAEARVESSRAKLRTKPDDPAANLAVGRFECFIEGDWSAGLPKLAKGNDTALKALAEQDLAAPNAEDQVATADKWWELAKREPALEHKQIQQHASELYRKALPSIAGLARARIEQRLGETHTTPKPSESLAHSTAIEKHQIPQSSIQLTNQTTAREASEILVAVLKKYPQTLEGVKRATLLAIQDGSAINHAEGVGRPVPGAFSYGSASATSNTFLFWNEPQKWNAGKYLVVYHLQQVSGAAGKNVAVMDCYASGDGVGSHQITADELPDGQWGTIPMNMNLETPREVQFRLYTYKKRTIILDRLYVFELQ